MRTEIEKEMNIYFFSTVDNRGLVRILYVKESSLFLALREAINFLNCDIVSIVGLQTPEFPAEMGSCNMLEVTP
jgi:hypothetical protein